MRIDWGAYYREFSQAHGGDPVVYRQDKETGRGGYLLFRTGWMYARSDPSGPEYAPKDEADRLEKVGHYWKLREGILRQALVELKEEIRALVTHQDTRSAPLMTVETVVVEDDAGNRSRRQQPVEIDFQLLLEKARILASELADCRRGLEDSLAAPEPRRLAAAVLSELDEIGS